MKLISFIKKHAVQNLEFVKNNGYKGVRIFRIPYAYKEKRMPCIAVVFVDENWDLNKCPDGHIYVEWKDRVEITPQQVRDLEEW